MEEKKEEKVRVRKNYSRNEVSQKMMAFRVDFENAEWLQQFPNKGRYINELNWNKDTSPVEANI